MATLPKLTEHRHAPFKMYSSFIYISMYLNVKWNSKNSCNILQFDLQLIPYNPLHVHNGEDIYILHLLVR